LLIDSKMSISGSHPLVLPSDGNIHSAGQNPWPFGILARISTRPYWKSNLVTAWPDV
jgi:hypothetical protein